MCFILPSAGRGQTFSPQTFHGAPDCRSMSVNFDPVFPFASLANQLNSAMCRSRHYATVGTGKEPRRERERLVKRITNKSTALETCEGSDQPQRCAAAMLCSNGNDLNISCVVRSSVREKCRATRRRSRLLMPHSSVRRRLHPRSHLQFS